MGSLLLTGDISHIETPTARYDINTDFRLWIRYMKALLEENHQEITDCIERICAYIHEDEDEILKQLLAYAKVSDGKQVDDEIDTLLNSGNEKLFDLLVDEVLVIADFQREYNINLLDPNLKLSWKRFNILLSNLSSDSSLSSRVELRGLDVNDVPAKKRLSVKQLQSKYALKDSTKTKKVSLEDRNKILINYARRRSRELNGKDKD